MKQAYQYISPGFPVFIADKTVGEVIKDLSEMNSAGFTSIYVIGKDRKLLGSISISKFLRAQAQQSLSSLVSPVSVVIPPETNQELAAQLALQYNLPELCVVDKDGYLRGIIPAISIFEILRQEHVEDLHRTAGIMRERAMARDAINSPPVRRVRHRLPWLLVGTVGSVASIFVTSQLEMSITKNIEIAFFVPAIVYLADAVGTQTESVVIRGLSLSRVSVIKAFWSEIRTGSLISLFLGILVFILIHLFYKDFRLALALGASTLAATFVATALGFLLPWSLSKAGQDPAFGAGPMATIIQDIMSLIIYVSFIRLLF